MIVSVDTGKRTSLSLNREFLVHGPTLWSPDGNEIIFYGVSKREPDKPDKPWIAPLAGGEPRLLRLPGAEQDGEEAIGARLGAWQRWRPMDDLFPIEGRGLEGASCWRFRARPDRRETRTTHFRYRSSWLQFFSRAGWQAYVRNREPHELDLRNSDR